MIKIWTNLWQWKREGTNKYYKEGHNYRGSRDSNDIILSTTLWQYIWKLRQIDIFLEKYNVLELTQKEIESLK